ncbi:hypothetical protein CI105_07335 [Candidatus Izimaplasma bacterium ZiA1]|uniref:hypothetical protein n=1 Tax=Candidatus Izimoplasma sp. ZiA1 TaxID=2024899 RepID=UPI000BAA4389|nr:hypothetical protein CI105_07335 [Candidatus Izimaplasma bacterium ZiA1]
MKKISLLLVVLLLVLTGCKKDEEINTVRDHFIVNQENRMEYLDIDVDFSKQTSGDKMYLTVIATISIKPNYQGGNVDITLEMKTNQNVLSSLDFTIDSNETFVKRIEYNTSTNIGNMILTTLNYGVYNVIGSVYAERTINNETSNIPHYLIQPKFNY